MYKFVTLLENKHYFTLNEKRIEMKKIIILLIISVVVSFKLFSQTHNIRINTGYLFSNIAVSPNNIYNGRDGHNSLLYGIGYEYKIKKLLNPQISINYFKLGFDDKFTFTNDVGEKTKIIPIPHHFYYLSVLVGNRFEIGKTFKGYLNVGVSPSILLDAYFYYPQEIVSILNIDPQVNLKDNMNNFDMGIYSVVGAEYNFSRVSVFLEAFINRSLTTYTNDTYLKTFSIYNYYYSVNLGIAYKVYNNKKR